MVTLKNVSMVVWSILAATIIINAYDDGALTFAQSLACSFGAGVLVGVAHVIFFPGD